MKRLIALGLTVGLQSDLGLAAPGRPLPSIERVSASPEFQVEAFSLYLTAAQFSRFLRKARSRWGLFAPVWDAVHAPGAGIIHDSLYAIEFDAAKKQWDAAAPNSPEEQAGWDAMQQALWRGAAAEQEQFFGTLADMLRSAFVSRPNDRSRGALTDAVYSASMEMTRGLRHAHKRISGRRGGMILRDGLWSEYDEDRDQAFFEEFRRGLVKVMVDGFLEALSGAKSVGMREVHAASFAAMGFGIRHHIEWSFKHGLPQRGSKRFLPPAEEMPPSAPRADGTRPLFNPTAGPPLRLDQVDELVRLKLRLLNVGADSAEGRAVREAALARQKERAWKSQSELFRFVAERSTAAKEAAAVSAKKPAPESRVYPIALPWLQWPHDLFPDRLLFDLLRRSIERTSPAGPLFILIQTFGELVLRFPDLRAHVLGRATTFDSYTADTVLFFWQDEEFRRRLTLEFLHTLDALSAPVLLITGDEVEEVPAMDIIQRLRRGKFDADLVEVRPIFGTGIGSFGFVFESLKHYLETLKLRSRLNHPQFRVEYMAPMADLAIALNVEYDRRSRQAS